MKPSNAIKSSYLQAIENTPQPPETITQSHFETGARLVVKSC